MRESIETDIRGWDAIADHRTGTAGDRETAEWLAGLIRGAGAQPTLEEFPFRRRVLHECSIRVDGREANGVPMFDGGLTDEAGVEAPLGALGDPERIGVCRFDPSPSELTRAMFRHRRAGAAPIVAIASGQRSVPGLALLNAEHFDEPQGPAVLQVSTEHGEWLEAAAGRASVGRLVAHASVETTSACNVQTEIQGSDETLAPLVIMTPRSAWWVCTAERGGGIAAWLACIRHFATQPPRRTVQFTANTGHELNHIGLQHYLERRPALVDGAHAWIHLGANFATRDGAVVYQTSDDALLTLGLGALADAGIEPDRVVPVGERPGGEAHNIYDGGGRYVSLLGGNRWFHHPDDRWPDTIDLDKTERVVGAVLAVAERLANAP